MTPLEPILNAADRAIKPFFILLEHEFDMRAAIEAKGGAWVDLHRIEHAIVPQTLDEENALVGV